MNLYKVLTRYLPIIVVLYGCNPGSPENVSAVESIPSPSSALEITVFPSSSTPTTRILITPEETSHANSNQFTPYCSDSVIEETPKDYRLDGIIIYEDLKEGVYKSVGGFPLKYSPIPIPGKEDGVWMSIIYGFSPDGEWLAYSPISGEIGITRAEYSRWAISLISREGKKIDRALSLDDLAANLPEGVQPEAWLSNEWINNDYLNSSVAIRLEKDSRRFSNFFSILDPFNGRWKDELIDQLPKLNRNYGAHLSPDLTRALYIDTDSDLVYWDLLQSNELWSRNDLLTMYGIAAEWSPDSSKLVYSSWGVQSPDDMKIMLIDRDGNSSLSLIKYLPVPTDFAISGISWSHNSRYIAIILNPVDGEDGGQILYVYDTRFNSLVFQCDLYNDLDDGIFIYWSQDDLSIAYSHNISSPLIVIDLRSGYATKLADKAIIHGWSSEFSWIRNK